MTRRNWISQNDHRQRCQKNFLWFSQAHDLSL